MSAIVYYVEFVLISYLALTLFLFLMGSFFPLLSFAARLLASYASLVLVAGSSCFTTIGLRILGYGKLSQWAAGRCFKYVMRLTTGVQFKIEDPHNYLQTRPAVFIGNHQTELDVLMLGCVFPKYCSITAKASLRKMPVLGQFMSLSGSVFIDRANSTSARSAMAGAVKEIQREKQSVYMFPEGTRSYSIEPELLPFKKGAFHLAVQAGVPIVPIVVANYSDILKVRGWKSRFTGGTILIKVLKPIETKNLTPSNVEDLTRDTRELMLQELISLTARHRGQPIAMPAQSSEGGVVRASGVDRS